MNYADYLAQIQREEEDVLSEMTADRFNSYFHFPVLPARCYELCRLPGAGSAGGGGGVV